MEETNDILNGYENTKYVHYKDSLTLPNTVAYDEIGKQAMSGVLKASWHVDGKLMQTYTEQENHVGVIAATRLGKTSSYVIPTILSFANQLIKKSMVITDPKGEIYRYTAQTLKDKGYKIILLNFRDYMHSECWNALTPIYRKFKSKDAIIDEVIVVKTEHGPRNSFRDKVYEDQAKLDEDILRAQTMVINDVSNDIDNLTTMLISVESQKDPFWEQAAQSLFKAFIWAMLEDSELKDENKITEDNFSFNTIFSVIESFNDDEGCNYEDNGYFTSRPKTSRAYSLAKNILIENSRGTRTSILSVFFTKLAIFKEELVRRVTCFNTFEMSELANGPIALFINYRDELKASYKVIQLFVQDAYRYLIGEATKIPDGKLDAAFYFILDEFGNFPAIPDFETTISACAGRNIWFILIIQSYAQLNNMYGPEVAEIIKDNLNVHVFFGSNNSSTLEEFSRECGQFTRISPLSALNGKGADIESYQTETISLVPKSRLAHFQPGECIITEANSGYVMLSKLERYFLCNEFKNLPLSSVNDYKSKVDFLDKKYDYKVSSRRKKRNPFDF